MSIRPEGWAYLAVMGFVLVGAVLRQINLLLVLYGMLAGLLLVSWWLVRVTLRKVQVRRKLPRSVCAGDLVCVELEVTNGRRGGSWALTAGDTIRREGAPRRAVLRPEVFFPYVAAGERRQAVYRGRLMRRGRYRLGPLRVSTRFPLGLLRHTVEFDQPDELIVYPRLGRLDRRWQQQRQTAAAGGGSLRRQQGIEDGDFYGLRDWRAGDSQQRIHWRTSARRQSLVVRQFERRRKDDLILVVELWQPERPAATDMDNVELAVSVAATIVAEVCRSGSRRIDLRIVGQSAARTSGPASAPLLHEALEMLALAAAGAKDGLPAALAIEPDVPRGGADVLIVSSRAVDLSDTVRFAALWDDPRLSAVIARTQAISAADPMLAQVYSPS